MNKFDDLIKVENTIASCVSYDQLNVAENMASNWLKIYGNLRPTSKFGRIRFDEGDHQISQMLSHQLSNKRMQLR